MSDTPQYVSNSRCLTHHLNTWTYFYRTCFARCFCRFHFSSKFIPKRDKNKLETPRDEDTCRNGSAAKASFTAPVLSVFGKYWLRNQQIASLAFPLRPVFVPLDSLDLCCVDTEVRAREEVAREVAIMSNMQMKVCNRGRGLIGWAPGPQGPESSTFSCCFCPSQIGFLNILVVTYIFYWTVRKDIFIFIRTFPARLTRLA